MSRVEGRSRFEDRSPFEQAQQPGKGSLFEEEPKRLKVEDEGGDLDFYEGDSDEEEPKRLEVEDEGEDLDFYEGDSDEEYSDDDFTTRYDVIEADLWDDYAPLLPNEEKEGRSCLHVPLCHKYQHVSQFEGLPFFELFKVRVRLNLKFSSDPINGRLYGAIVTKPYDPSDENPDPISYYEVSKQKADYVTLDSVNNTILLPLSGPQPRPPISYERDLTFRFAFKLEDMDIFEYGYPYENPELFDDDGCGNYTAKAGPMYLTSSYERSHRDYGPFIARKVVGEPSFDRILMAAYYSVYFGAWATVDVKFLKKGVSSFYGFIYARPCIFYRRIRLLSIHPNDQKGELEQESGSIKLTRSVVAVPSYSSLIIAAVLYDQCGKRIVRGKTCFPALEEGSDSNIIHYEGVASLDVTVRWKCKR